MNKFGSRESLAQRTNEFLAKLLSCGRGHLVPLISVLVGVAVSAIAFWFLSQLGSGTCAQPYMYTQFAGLPSGGSSDRLSHCADLTPWELLWPDLVLIAGYMLVGSGGILGGWWRYETPRLMAIASMVIFLPLLVGLIDLVENLITVILLRCNGIGCVFVGDGWAESARIVTVIASIKWLLAAIAVVIWVMSIAVWLSRGGNSFCSDTRNCRRVDQQTDRQEEVRESAMDVGGPRPSTQLPCGPGPMFLGFSAEVWEEEYRTQIQAQRSKQEERIAAARCPEWGLSSSGGGIRSSGFTLGALTRLELAGRMDSVERVTAVSGGAWAATAWVLRRAQDPTTFAAADVRDFLLALPDKPGTQQSNDARPWSSRVRYLLNGPGGIIGPLTWVILCAATTILILTTITYLVSWFPGKVLTMGFLYPGLITEGPVVAPTLDNPGVFIACTGVIVMFAFGFSKRIAKAWKPAIAMVAAGIVVYAYSELFPSLLTYMRETQGVRDALAAFGSALAAMTAFGAIAIQLWKIFGRRVQAKVAAVVERNLTRLFGLVLLALLSVVSVVVAAAAAFGTSADLIKIDEQIGATSTLLWIAGLLVVLYVVAGGNSPSLAQIFGKRLARSFDMTLQDRMASTLRRAGEYSGSDAVGSWDWLSARSKVSDPTSNNPELILCCAQQRNGLAAGGLPADSLTISPKRISVGASSRDVTGYLKDAVKVRKFVVLREYPQIEYVASWLPVTGAAFSSAMGRTSLGTTNAALAAFNADLGAWIPNTFTTRSDSWVRPRIAHILKEVLGWYSPADRFVFATDGGHWDNLGLVEQIRLGSNQIICLDASNDAPGTFKALREAIDLVCLEMATPFRVADLEEQLAPLTPMSTGLPERMATKLQFTLGAEDGFQYHGVIYYAKLQICATMPINLKRYALEDRGFPTYSTFNQFMSNRRFEMLLAAGECAADQLMALMDGDDSTIDYPEPTPSAAIEGEKDNIHAVTLQANASGRRLCLRIRRRIEPILRTYGP